MQKGAGEDLMQEGVNMQHQQGAMVQQWLLTNSKTVQKLLCLH
jgi:hypothetical protein